MCVVMDEAYVTLATNDSYAIGALVLGHSLRNTGTTRCLVVMVTNDVTDTFRYALTYLLEARTCHVATPPGNHLLVCLSVCLSSALWKTADRTRMPFGSVGLTGPWMR